ncbi:hypothetical protein ACFPRL_31980 [Pseudoclavibacter helvolus]
MTSSSSSPARTSTWARVSSSSRTSRARSTRSPLHRGTWTGERRRCAARRWFSRTSAPSSRTSTPKRVPRCSKVWPKRLACRGIS